jgi:hypothetical protein
MFSSKIIRRLRLRRRIRERDIRRMRRSIKAYDDILKSYYLTGRFKDPVAVGETLSQNLLADKKHLRTMFNFKRISRNKILIGKIGLLRGRVVGKINRKARSRWQNVSNRNNDSRWRPSTNTFSKPTTFAFTSAEAKIGSFGVSFIQELCI